MTYLVIARKDVQQVRFARESGYETSRAFPQGAASVTARRDWR